jgi:hydrogenase expression/formation protein HypE
MAHGAGGAATRRLLEHHVLPRLGNPQLDLLADAALVDVGAAGRVAVTTDAFVVRPRRFPGGSVGSLAVHGTVNDLAVSGARAVALTASWILEEGWPLAELDAELDAMADAAATAGVHVLAGDTKVVERGAADGCYVTTTGLGVPVARHGLSPTLVRPGDRILVSGPVGDHGTAVLLARGDLHIDADVRSDSRSVWPVAEALLAACGDGLRCMRDPTRGGVATVLNEFALEGEVVVELEESDIPVRPAVRGALELLGLDPLYVANEGCLVAVVDPQLAEAALAAARGSSGGEQAVLIGEVVESGAPGRVVARTTFGGRRVVDLLSGDPLPRIC